MKCRFYTVVLLFFYGITGKHVQKSTSHESFLALLLHMNLHVQLSWRIDTEEMEYCTLFYLSSSPPEWQSSWVLYSACHWEWLRLERRLIEAELVCSFSGLLCWVTALLQASGLFFCGLTGGTVSSKPCHSHTILTMLVERGRVRIMTNKMCWKNISHCLLESSLLSPWDREMCSDHVQQITHI